MHDDGKAVAQAIDGEDGRAWHLPLPPLSATSLPEVFSRGEAPDLDRARAAYRLVDNHAAVARFAARGAGQPGARPVWAPLADPSAVPNESAVEHVDAALRCVASALLHGPELCAQALQVLKVRGSVASITHVLQCLDPSLWKCVWTAGTAWRCQVEPDCETRCSCLTGDCGLRPMLLACRRTQERVGAEWKTLWLRSRT